jgi:hypothetical protein
MAEAHSKVAAAGPAGRARQGMFQDPSRFALSADVA